MQVTSNVSLKLYSTMRLGGKASNATTVHTKEEMEEAAKWALEHNLPIRVIGEGSNVIWKDEGFNGLLVKNEIKDYKKLSEDLSSVVVEIGSGELFDEVVEKTVNEGLSGLEFLSLIPGTVGATPIQNVGAYGQEISRLLVSVEAYDTKDKRLVTLTNDECGFGYRTSIFKTLDNGRYLIVSVCLKLSKKVPTPPFYHSLQSYLDEHDIKDCDAPTIRKAVIAIRLAKLPDWHKVANCGSFFANPIVSKDEFTKLKADYPEIVAWPYESDMKLAAAWIIEQAGFKDVHDSETGMATWKSQPLVLVNEQAKSTSDLLKFKEKIVQTVKEKFGVILEQEPELLP